MTATAQSVCIATTAKGHPCKGRPLVGRDVCKAHSGDPDVGQPSRLTEDVQHRVAQFLQQGNFIEPACLYAGISVSTYYGWRERGEADRDAGRATPYVEFLEATTRAIAEGELTATAKLRQNVMEGDQRAIEFYLERRHGERWGRKDNVQVHGSLRRDPPAVPDDDGRLLEVGGILAAIGAAGEDQDGE